MKDNEVIKRRMTYGLLESTARLNKVRNILRLVTVFVVFTAIGLFVVSGKFYCIINGIAIEWKLSGRQFLIAVPWVIVGGDEMVRAYYKDTNVVRSIVEIVLRMIICIVASVAILIFADIY